MTKTHVKMASCVQISTFVNLDQARLIGNSIERGRFGWEVFGKDGRRHGPTGRCTSSLNQLDVD